MYCKNCGAQINDKAEYCTWHFGHKKRLSRNS
ncbi:zinc-ribbon domain-containing protein [Clostridium algoriphilum]|nr:zinc-ribbon domain-containing protein [Clostridium algoriphilum]MCB2292506.1 zinc-ribbon domain-containing protein [Clostridium algoriphilum]